MRIPAAFVAVALSAGLSAGGCSKPVDLKQALQVTDLAGGYHDAGVVGGRNKIVPSLTFRIKKNTSDSLRPLSLNISFKQRPPADAAVAPGSPAETDWDEKFVQSVAFDGDVTAPLNFKSEAGYTADPPQTRADMIKNRSFQDVRVHIFAKHSASQWVEIATFDVPRQILAQ